MFAVRLSHYQLQRRKCSLNTKCSCPPVPCHGNFSDWITVDVVSQTGDAHLCRFVLKLKISDACFSLCASLFRIIVYPDVSNKRLGCTRTFQVIQLLLYILYISFGTKAIWPEKCLKCYTGRPRWPKPRRPQYFRSLIHKVVGVDHALLTSQKAVICLWYTEKIYLRFARQHG